MVPKGCRTGLAVPGEEWTMGRVPWVPGVVGTKLKVLGTKLDERTTP